MNCILIIDLFDARNIIVILYKFGQTHKSLTLYNYSVCILEILGHFKTECKRYMHAPLHCLKKNHPYD